MPKNKGKGGKNRKRGTNKNEPVKRELVLKEDGQEYAQLTKMLGNSRVECQLFNGSKCIGVIRGAIRRKVWMSVGDILLVGLRDFEDTKCDVIGKYMPEEAKQLVKDGHIPEHVKVDDGTEQPQQSRFEFVADGDFSDDSSEGGNPNFMKGGAGSDSDSDDERGTAPLNIDDI